MAETDNTDAHLLGKIFYHLINYNIKYSFIRPNYPNDCLKTFEYSVYYKERTMYPQSNRLYCII